MEFYTRTIGINNDTKNKATSFAMLKIVNNQVPEKLESCLSNDINVGLIVEPTANEYAETYQTVDAVKNIIKEYEINCPIYYDINTFTEEDPINTTVMAHEFCEKLEANNCYVGLYGTAENFELLSEYYEGITKKDINTIDKLLKINNNISLPDKFTYNMIELPSGIYAARYDFPKIIQNEELNTPTGFLVDVTHTVQKQEDIRAISKEHQIPYEELKEYNNLTKDNLKTGSEITIPNEYYFVDHLKEAIIKDKRDIVKGIDISKHQDGIELSKSTKDTDYLILNLCDFINTNENGETIIDPKFSEYAKYCEKNNIPYGVYYFSRATNPLEARNEAKFVAKKLQNYHLSYPIYIDIESPEHEQMVTENSNILNEIVLTAAKTLEKAGYFPAIYCNESTYTILEPLSEYYTFWIAYGKYYNYQMTLDNIIPTDFPLPALDAHISSYQFTQNGEIEGSPVPVDIDYATPVLTEVVKDYSLKKQQTLK